MEFFHTTGYYMRIQELKARGPEWWIQYYDNARKLRAEKCPDEFQSKQGAKNFEAIRRSEISRGVYDNKDVRQARISEVVDAYLAEKIAEKKSKSSVQTLGNHIKRHIGQWRLDHIDRNPALIVNHFRKFPETSWSQKYIWNYFVTLRAAVNHWIRFRRLFMHNPCDLVQIDPGVKVMEYVPTQEDFERVIAQSYIIGLPDWIRNLMVIVFETGLRINEVMQMTVNDVCLDPGEGLPYIWIWISKQKRHIRQAIPITSKAAGAFRSQVAGRSSGNLWPVKNPPYKQFKVKQEDGTYKTLFELAGVDFRPFHDYRKTAKLKFKVAGGREVAKSMQGHRTDAMDDYYTHFQRPELEKAVASTWGHNDQTHDQNKKGE
jgi:integrase